MLLSRVVNARMKSEEGLLGSPEAVSCSTELGVKLYVASDCS